MSLDETETKQPQNPKEETKTPQPPTDTIKTLRDTTTDIPEKIGNSLEKPKPSSQLPIAIISKQRTEQTTVVKPQAPKTSEDPKKQHSYGFQNGKKCATDNLSPPPPSSIPPWRRTFR